MSRRTQMMNWAQAAPNIPGCACDRDDDSGEDGPARLCPMHEKMLRPLRWDTLAVMVIDLEAAIHKMRGNLS